MTDRPTYKVPTDRAGAEALYYKARTGEETPDFYLFLYRNTNAAMIPRSRPTRVLTVVGYVLLGLAGLIGLWTGHLVSVLVLGVIVAVGMYMPIVNFGLWVLPVFLLFDKGWLMAGAIIGSNLYSRYVTTWSGVQDIKRFWHNLSEPLRNKLTHWTVGAIEWPEFVSFVINEGINKDRSRLESLSEEERENLRKILGIDL